MLQQKIIEYLSASDIMFLEDIKVSLEPISLLIKTLSKQNLNYNEMDQICEFVLEKLLKNNSSYLSQKLFVELTKRIIERRNIVLATTVCYLNNTYKFNDKTILQHCTKNECYKFIEIHYTRLFKSKEINIIEDISNPPVNNKNQDLMSEFQNFKNLKKHNFAKNSILNDLVTFEISGILSDKLILIKNALESIQPTSVLCERAFSIAGNFLRKRRNKIGDELIDALIILSQNN